MVTMNVQRLKEIRIHWDWQTAVIPSEYVKKLQYQQEKMQNNEIECREVSLEIDLQYTKTQKIMNELENKEEKTLTIFEALQFKNIWYIEVVDNGQKCTLGLPSDRKEFYCGKEFMIPEDAKNLCEHHKIEKDVYCITWDEPEQKDVFMSQEEIRNFLKKKMLSKIEGLNCQLGIELFDRILALNQAENLKTIHRVHKVDKRRGIIYGIRKGYTLSEEHCPLHGIDIFILNAKNHAHHWNINFILVPNLENKEEKQAMYQVLEEGMPNEDTKNYFCRRIFIFNNNTDIEKWKSKFYEKTNNEALIFTTYQEVNQIWYTIRKEWNLL